MCSGRIRLNLGSSNFLHIAQRGLFSGVKRPVSHVELRLVSGVKDPISAEGYVFRIIGGELQTISHK